MTEASTPAARIRERGYALLEGLYTAAEIGVFRDTLDDLRAQHGAAELTARDPVWLADGVEVAGPGLAFYGLLGFAPSLAPALFKAEAVTVMRDVLGTDMHLELIGAVMSDETRSFTEWESHLGGIDDERWRRAGKRPRHRQVQRLVHFLFLEDMDTDSGPWRLLPRAVGDPVDPPASIDDPGWPGTVALACRAGTVLLLEESVWHAVMPRRKPGVRRFIGAYFASSAADAPMGRDTSLDALGAGNLEPLLASLLVNRPPAR